MRKLLYALSKRDIKKGKYKYKKQKGSAADTKP